MTTKSPLYRSEAWLRRKYIEERKSIKDIAAECGASYNSVASYLRKFKIIK